jgi:hypothetical protein
LTLIREVQKKKKYLLLDKPWNLETSRREFVGLREVGLVLKTLSVEGSDYGFFRHADASDVTF